MQFRFTCGLFLLILIGQGLSPQALAADNNLSAKDMRLLFESPVFLQRSDLVITDADVDAFVHARVPAGDRVSALASPDRIGNLLTSLLISEAMLVQAQAHGLLDGDVAQARLYRSVVNEVQGIYRDHYLADIELDSYEDSARELHITRPEQFMTPDLIDFEHLLIAVDPKRSEVEAMALVVDLHSRLTSGESFSVLARQYSDDPSVADNEGLLAQVNPSDLVPQLAGRLGEATVGRYADPIRTRFGWHIVRLVEVHPGRRMNWEEAQPHAERVARDRHRTLAWERLLRDLQEEQVEFADGAVARLLQRYGVVPADDSHSASVERLLEGG
jgi:peptidyl-prolyl cis-trans isomerase C